ncbi:MAG: alpha/beta hydrolase [Planctomycetota bacterium]|jgi:acetyl esterase/lipase
MRTASLLAFMLSLCSAQSPKHAGYLGARLADVESGVQLARVLPDTPAAKAGLLTGDVIVGVGKMAEFAEKLRRAGAGAELELEVLRGDEKRTIVVTLGIHPRVLLEQPDTSPGMLAVKATRDLSYFSGEGVVHERHRLNLFEPVTEEPFPVVLWIHAGAWSYGDRSGETALAMRFAERGIGFAAMSYRLSSKFWNDPSAPKEGVRHPAHAEDCAMAFAWLRKRYPGRALFLSGHSCGAHLAALLAMDSRYVRRHGLELKEIRGVVAIGGAYDLVKYHATLAGPDGLGKEKADAHLGWIFGETREGWVQASPATYLAGCTMPMVIVGEKGAGMRIYHEDFRSAVKEAGVTSIRFVEADDRTHGQSTPFMSRKQPDAVRDMMIEFVREQSR